MGSLNRATVLGRLGQDVELRYAGNTPVCNLSIATSESWKDKGSGEKKERTEWHRCVCWGQTAEIAAKYLAKGREVLVEGRLQTSEWEKDGIKRYKTEIVVDKLVLLGNGGSREGDVRTSTGKPPEDNHPGPGADDYVPF